MSEETTYYSKGDVTVTNARVVIDGATYAMRNITSVKMSKKPPSFSPYAFLMIGGLVIGASVGGIVGTMIALASFGGGAYLFFISKPDCIVIIGSASGEAKALTSKNEGKVQEIVNAVNEAIIKRG